MKRIAIDWKKTFANHRSNKEILPRMCKVHSTLNNDRTNEATTTTTTTKWVKTFSRHFPKEDIQIINKHMKISSKLLILRESQMKTTVS